MIISVSCPGLPDLSATVATVPPRTGTVRGTIVAHAGGGGMGFFDAGPRGAGFSALFPADGFRYVQIAWAGDWAGTGKGIKQSACRPATAFQWVFSSIHSGNRTQAFCGAGSSGGTAALLFSMTSYGLKDSFDYLLLAAGPTPSRIDYGCQASAYTGPPRTLCPLLTMAPYLYADTPGVPNIVDGWEGTKTCGATDPPAKDLTTWAADGLVSSGSDFTYPKTGASFWFCVTDPNVSTGQATFFIERVHPKKDPADVNCYSGACQGEGVFQDSSALSQAVSEMETACVPNHR